MLAGASSGMGKAIALAFAQQGSKVHICIWSRSRSKLEQVAQEIQALGANAHIMTGDLTDPADCKRCVGEAVSLPAVCVVRSLHGNVSSVLVVCSTVLFDLVEHTFTSFDSLRYASLCAY